jgi:hypothetical protein
MKHAFRAFGAFVAAVITCCAIAAVAIALPAERRYEMVTPPYKGGFPVGAELNQPGIRAVSSNGESVTFFSGGAFAGAPSGLQSIDYLARRGESDWSTVPLMPPASLQPILQGSDVSPSLDMVLKLGFPGSSFANTLNEMQVLLHSPETPDTIDNWEFEGSVTTVGKEKVNAVEASASLDFCHMLLEGNSPLLLEAVGASEELYQYDRGCNGEPRSLMLVGLDNASKLIDPACYTVIGDGDTNGTYGSGMAERFNAASADGSEVFFTTCVKATKEPVGPNVPHQVFVRLAGSRTLEVSRPLETGKAFGGCEREVSLGHSVPGEVPCDGASERASADFAGASQDGSKVYFTTAAPLVEGDTDSGNDLYMATIGCPGGRPACGVSEREVTSLTQVTHDPSSGQAANVLGVVRLAPDGTHAYFVAGGNLLSSGQQAVLEGEGRNVPHVGAANLYVYDVASPGGVAFVGDLCSGSSLSGAVADIFCPSTSGKDETLWMHEEGEAQTAGLDGRFLVFATYAQLSASDANVTKDVYRYDAVTGRLVRVSGGEGGYDANGNRQVLGENGEPLGASIMPGHYGGLLQAQYEMNNRAINEDGSRVVFSSAEPLSPNASNGQLNAYEWREGPGEGRVSLISDGSGPGPVPQVVISSSGDDIFFLTSDGLVPQDTDGALDIYDARVGGGFPPASATEQQCSGDACQGPLTNPAPLLVPGSVSQAPGGNFAAPAAKAKTTKKAKPVKCKRGYVKKKTRCVKQRVKRKAKKSSRKGGK